VLADPNLGYRFYAALARVLLSRRSHEAGRCQLAWLHPVALRPQ